MTKGEIIEINGHRIMCGDATSQEDVLRDIRLFGMLKIVHVYFDKKTRNFVDYESEVKKADLSFSDPEGTDMSLFDVLVMLVSELLETDSHMTISCVRVRVVMLLMSLTKTALAKLLNVSPRLLDSILYAEVTMGIPFAIKLVELLKIDYNMFFKWFEPKIAYEIVE